MGCCLETQTAQEAERRPLVDPLSLAKFRDGRVNRAFSGHHRCIKGILKGISISFGIWNPSGWAIILSFLMCLICLFQLAYDLFVVCGCPGFDCGFLQKQESSPDRKHKPYRNASNMMYTLASLGGFFSYTLLFICLLLIRRRRLRYGYKALRPIDVLENDLSDTQLTVLSVMMGVIVCLFLGSVGLFYYIIHSQPSGAYFDWLAVGVGSQFLSQWAAIVACLLFAINCFAMGSLANDTVRRIKQMKLSKSSRPIRGRRTDGPEDQHVDDEITEGITSSSRDVTEGITSSSREGARAKHEGKSKPVAQGADSLRGQLITAATIHHVETEDKPTTSEDSTLHPENTSRNIGISAAPSEPKETTSSTTSSSTSSYTSAASSIQHDVDTPKDVPITSRDLDQAIEYHEELCAIVSDTVSAFCPWFVVHWLFYGSTSLLAVVEISEEITFGSTPLVNLVYIGCFVLCHVILFLMPCCCAAYITDACGGIHVHINKTTSAVWGPGHPFRDRAQLMMFTAYAKDRQCVFKIGRVTFTSTLAWVSLLLGSTGLLFHFF